MLIDLHTHTRRFSPCSTIAPAALLEEASRSDLDAVVLTEHDRFWPETDLRRLRRDFPKLRVFNGIEIEVDSLHHVLTLLPEPSEDLLQYWSPEAFLEEVDRRDGFTIAAHPFRVFPDYHRRNQDYPLDGVEIASNNMFSPRREKQARQLALEWSSQVFSNSDAHSAGPVGSFYTRIPGDPANEAELIEALRSGETVPVFPSH